MRVWGLCLWSIILNANIADHKGQLFSLTFIHVGLITWGWMNESVFMSHQITVLHSFCCLTSSGFVWMQSQSLHWPGLWSKVLMSHMLSLQSTTSDGSSHCESVHQERERGLSDVCTVSWDLFFNRLIRLQQSEVFSIKTNWVTTAPVAWQRTHT